MTRTFQSIFLTGVLLINVIAAEKQTGAPVISPIQKPNMPKQIEPLKRRISLDSGYLPSLNSNRAIGEFNSEAVGGSVYGGAVFNKLWSVQAGVTYHNAKTFQGERNIPSYKNGDTDIEAWLKLGVVY